MNESLYTADHDNDLDSSLFVDAELPCPLTFLVS